MSTEKIRFQDKSLIYLIPKNIEKLHEIILSLPKESNLNYSKDLSAIENRYYDPELKLALIGNFSCGKSTFLNALLGQDLLTTGACPTTAIPTYIRWNKKSVKKEIASQTKIYEINRDEPLIKIVLKDEKTYWLIGKSQREFEKALKIKLSRKTGSKIDYLTTTSKLSNKIKQIELYFPERKGFEDFCLIDTPGINPGDEKSVDHIVQTQRVLRDNADAAIVLYPSTQVMTRNTYEFLKETGGEKVLKNAIIILTQWDLMSEKSKNKVVDYTKKVVAGQYHQRNPLVLTISAYEALKYLSGEEKSNETKKWTEDFYKAIAQLMYEVYLRRTDIILDKVISLIQKLIVSMTQYINEEIENQKKIQQKIEVYSYRGLQAKFNQLLQEYKEKLEFNAAIRRFTADLIVDEMVTQKSEYICQKIDAAQNQEELDYCTQEYYKEAFTDLEPMIVQKINTKVMKEVDDLNQHFVNSVEKCLKDYRRHLGKIDNHTLKVTTEILKGVTLDTSINSASFFKRHETMLDASRFIPGARILLLIFGYLWNAGKFESQKEDAKKEVQTKLEEYSQKMGEICKQSLKEKEEENLKWAMNLLQEYTAQYKQSFVRIEEEWKKSKESIQANIDKYHKLIVDIEKMEKMFSELSEKGVQNAY